MKYSFIFTHAGCLRMFDALIKGILDQGDEVCIIYTKKPSKVGEGLSERLLTYSENVSIQYLSQLKIKTSNRLHVYILLLDWLRYFHKDYKNMPALRERVYNHFNKKTGLKILRTLIKVFVFIFGKYGLVFLNNLIKRKINIWPPQQRLIEYFSENNSDIFIVSPLVEIASSQVEPILALQKLGKKINFIAHSWDNLTNKGLVRLNLYQHFVWNKFQKQELLKYHNVSADTIRVYGCSAYDTWFDMRPMCSREEFCARNKLDPSKPFVLFTASSSFISKSHEVKLIEKLEKCFVESKLTLQKDMQILIRPHPQNAAIWADFKDTERAKLSENKVLMPVASDAKQYYFESIYYSAAVIGINTSAMIEASIIGVPVICISTREFEATQSGTLHFKYLKSEANIPVVKNLEDLPFILQSNIDNLNDIRQHQLNFISSFIRPKGIDKNVTSLIINKLKQTNL